MGSYRDTEPILSDNLISPHSSYTHCRTTPFWSTIHYMMQTKKNVLIVEDERALADILQDYLEATSFATRCLYDGHNVVDEIKRWNPDLILLDLMLPGKDGLEICKEVRLFSDIPIIMITARVEEIDRLLGLELGADDYVCKPYSPREVVARVKAVLRRFNPHKSPTSHSTIQLDEHSFQANINNQPIELTPVEFRLLQRLNGQPGRVFSRSQLIEHLYEDHRVVTDRTVDTHIKNLRKKIEALTPDQTIIHSVYGVGYKIEITEIDSAS